MNGTANSIIRADESYSVPEFCRRVGLGRYAFGQARKNGLAVVEFGRKRRVRGVDWLDFERRMLEKQRAKICEAATS